MESSPVLETMAARQLEDGTPLASDAAEYLRRYGSAAMKPVMWEQLSRWHKKYAESGAELRIMDGQKVTSDDWRLYNLESRLRKAYITAQGWTLSPNDEARLSELIGDKSVAELACTFSCGGSLSVGSGPDSYYIYGQVNDPVFPIEARIDYLMPTEPFHYLVKQYRCANLQGLEQKLLQFPVGSTFSVAHTGSILDGHGDWTNISTFLKSHGYSFKD
jgi:hypothetical protein